MIIINMFPKSLVETMVNSSIYVYVRGVEKEFAGILKSVTEHDLLVIEDRNNNLIYIHREDITVLTERR